MQSPDFIQSRSEFRRWRNRRQLSFTSKRHFVTGIDGLRTLAVVGVIVYHLMPNVMMGGFLGVPLFLLISGYFVTNQLLKRWQMNGQLSILNFYGRRFNRLYPVLIAMLAMTTAYITLFDKFLLHNIRPTIITNLLWVYNWWEIPNGQSYFDRFSGESPFTHLWTLGVMMQNYWLWPLILLVLLLLCQRFRGLLKWLILALAILSAVEMGLLFNPQNLNRVYYGTDTRAFSFLLGAFLACFWPLDHLNDNLPRNGRRVLDVIGVLTLAATIYGFLTLNGQDSFTYHGGMFLYSLIGMVLIATIVHPGADMNRWLTNPVFSWCGQRSFGIYVYQFPVMIFYEHAVRVGLHPVLNSLAELAIILGVSELSYRFVEKPLMHYDWTRLPETVASWFNFRRNGIKPWLAIVPAVAVFLTATYGFCQPDHAPKANVVQTHIKTNAKRMAKHNRAVAKGQAAVNVNAKSVAKKYSLNSAQVAKAKKLEVTAVGDSVMADASDSLQQVMPHAFVDAQVGRQGDATPAVIKSLKAKGQLKKIVVLNLGTNGPMTPQTVNAILSAIGPGHQVYWVNAHVPTKDWQQAVNKEIHSAAKNHKNVHEVNWYGLSQQHDDWFADDHVHMNQQGNVNFTRLIVTTILQHQ